jgi:hypothetical protein
VLFSTPAFSFEPSTLPGARPADWSGRGRMTPSVHPRASALEHALQENVLEIATTIEHGVDLNHVIEPTIDDSPRRLL